MDTKAKTPAPDGSLDDAPCGYLAFDSDGHILATNKTLRDWLRMSPSDLADLPAPQIFTIASRVVFETSVMPLLSLQGSTEGVSLDLRVPGGDQIPVLLSAETSGYASGCVTRIILLKAGPRRAYERRLSEARAEAETKLLLEQREGELREEFVAIVGHDLRNPLASVSAAIRMLSREPLGDEGVKIVQLAQGSIHRMSRLIDNVMEMARNRLGSGIKLDLSNDRTLENQIRQIVQESNLIEPDRDIRLSLSLNEGIRCDVSRIGQLLSNLVGNAMTHGDQAFPIHVAATTLENGDFELSVSNRGAPIPPSAMPRLFDPFVRSTDRDDMRGLGLGLHIASEIAKAHGGSLQVKSDDGETTFTFRMPSAPSRLTD